MMYKSPAIIEIDKLISEIKDEITSEETHFPQFLSKEKERNERIATLRDKLRDYKLEKAKIFAVSKVAEPIDQRPILPIQGLNKLPIEQQEEIFIEYLLAHYEKYRTDSLIIRFDDLNFTQYSPVAKPGLINDLNREYFFPFLISRGYIIPKDQHSGQNTIGYGQVHLTKNFLELYKNRKESEKSQQVKNADINNNWKNKPEDIEPFQDIIFSHGSGKIGKEPIDLDNEKKILELKNKFKEMIGKDTTNESRFFIALRTILTILKSGERIDNGKKIRFDTNSADFKKEYLILGKLFENFGTKNKGKWHPNYRTVANNLFSICSSKCYIERKLKGKPYILSIKDKR